MKLTILSPGPLSTIQDAGRFAAMGKGFSPGGAMDLEAMTLANLLVGNAPGVGVIEMPMLGITARFDCDCGIALTGADMSARLNELPVEPYCSISVHSGDVLSMKAAKSGMRAYLAVAGGFGRRNMNLSPAEVQNLITYRWARCRPSAAAPEYGCATSSPTGPCTTWRQKTRRWQKPSVRASIPLTRP